MNTDTQIQLWILIVTVLFSAISLVLSFQAMAHSRHEVRLNLYERRMKYFEATRRIMGHVFGTGSPELGDLNEFHSLAAESKFLFDTDVQLFIEAALKTYVRMHTNYGFLTDMNLSHDARERALKELQADRRFLMEEHSQIYQKFLPYLDFRGFKITSSEHFGWTQ